ncbi:type II secretion system protein [bacterium]|nr:type II secretion system protein [bacterium]
MLQRKGITLLDVVILILIVGVAAALILPHIRKAETERLEQMCRLRMRILADAELTYYLSGGLLPEIADSIPDSTLDDSKEIIVDKEEEIELIHLYTDDIEKLKPFMSDNAGGIPVSLDTISFVCPLDNQEFIFIVEDSLFYSISCPNGHGHVIKGNFSWETK